MPPKKKTPLALFLENPVTKILLSPDSSRILIMVLVLSMHPLGQKFLSSFGFTFDNSSAGVKKDIEQVKSDVVATRDDLSKARQSIGYVQMDDSRLKNQMTSLEVNIDKLKKEQIQNEHSTF